jgi:hypothetical protein
MSFGTLWEPENKIKFTDLDLHDLHHAIVYSCHATCLSYFPKGGSCCAHVVDIRFLNEIFTSWLLTIMLGLSTLDMPIALLVDLNSLQGHVVGIGFKICFSHTYPSELLETRETLL